VNSPSEHEFTKQVGAKLRLVRQSRGWSLMDVEQKSDGQWCAVVVGSYERGDRHGTIGRINSLCEWYGVPLTDVLPGRERDGEAEVQSLAERVLTATVQMVREQRDGRVPA